MIKSELSFKLVPADNLVIVGNCRTTGVAEVDEGMSSIADFGLLQPILVKDIGQGRYKVIAGHRRVAALKQAGHSAAEVKVLPPGADELMVQYVENADRKQMRLDHEGALFTAMIARGWTAKKIATSTGRPTDHVEKCLRLYQYVPKEFQGLVGNVIKMNPADTIRAKCKEANASGSVPHSCYRALSDGYSLETVVRMIPLLKAGFTIADSAAKVGIYVERKDRNLVNASLLEAYESVHGKNSIKHGITMWLREIEHEGLAILERRKRDDRG